MTLDLGRYPFTINHDKCLLCQQVDRLTEEEREGKINSGTWQKGVHLCSTCQWHAFENINEQLRRKKLERELADVIDEFNDFTIDTIYPDQINIRQLETKIEAMITEKPTYRRELEPLLERVVAVEKQGFSGKCGVLA